ncbi:PLP-dependent aminotransferase family protein [Luteipulveratus mongoliensis]|uniref:HTH gntR-type domain-containing protein n=1 Tax=Luteipulveratus mongoliensis TaxID=571913 RepID=A0A0K1JL11_9MICO|nr:PLP-dependent aminotransferase family protein [Luteipulveratus mongoliensis]AKU17401.1 hypothetical protein VV02_18665 [Luteipulveratus mongoliensis]
MARTARVSSLLVDAEAAATPDGLGAAIVGEIAVGRLGVGDPLPSSRALAGDLGVARSLVVTTYDALAAAGIITVAAGSGAAVAVTADVAAASLGVGTAPQHQREPLQPRLVRPQRIPPARLRFNLSPGAPDVTLIREADWRQAWRAASQTVPDLDWYHPMQHPELEQALVTHLRRTRGIPVEQREVIIFPGVSAAIQAIVHALEPQRVAMEDPGYPLARIPLQQNVARVDLIPVDAGGLCVDALSAQDLAYVTPAHQFPLGGRLSAVRREQLLRWADREDAVIVEDDFDGEYRHDATPLGPLRSMSGGADRVAYIGTASKILTPHLRLAWAVVPGWMADAVRVAGGALRLDASRVASMALAQMISSGNLSRHLARAQRTYAARRRRLVDALHASLPHVEVLGVEAGIHVAVRWEDSSVSDVDAVEELAARGIVVAALSEYAVSHPVNGLLLGYAQLPETGAQAAVHEIADALKGVGLAPNS